MSTNVSNDLGAGAEEVVRTQDPPRGGSWPRPAQWLDLLALTVLLGLALSGLGSSLTGVQYWLVGMAGVLLGIGSVLLTRAWRMPSAAAVLVAVLVFWLLGGPLTLRSLGDTAWLPTGATTRELLDQVLYGWKGLLTTLPPVDGSGPVLVLPWALGLGAGLLGAFAVLWRPRRDLAGAPAALLALAPVLVCLAALALVVLLGVARPHSLLLQGLLFALVALGWLALRGQRESAREPGGRRRPRERTRGLGRALSAVALLALAGLLAWPVAGAVLPDDSSRTVLRSRVQPPFDVGRYPSPLAAFRRYVDLGDKQDPTNLYNAELFRIEGLPAGTRVRVAALDHWDGLAYGATNDPLVDEGGDAFQRVSSVIDNPVEGRRVSARVRLGEDWSGVWLPTAGALQGLRFETGDARAKADSFRYNLATSTAVVPSGLHPGDSYAFEAVLGADKLDASAVPSARLGDLSEDSGFLDQPVEAWSEEAGTPMERVFAVAEHLRTEGRYSDGVRKAERGFYPGHGLKRLSDGFVNAEPMAGNDEQYAAVMALMANRIGVPARVVLGAVVPEDGVVTGREISAWVELRVADGSWRTLPTEAFMSDRPPSEQQPQTQEPMSGTVVPPPAPIPPPSDLGESADSDLRARMQAEQSDEDVAGDQRGLPVWVGAVLRYVGVPLLAVAALLGGVLGAKVLRRRRRRTTGAASTRVGAAWRELVDHARDLGRSVPLWSSTTRREQSGAVGSDAARALARRADGYVFGPTPPRAEDAEAFWESVIAERRRMSAGLSRWQRWRAALNPVTLLPFRTGPTRPAAPAQPD